MSQATQTPNNKLPDTRGILNARTPKVDLKIRGPPSRKKCVKLSQKKPRVLTMSMYPLSNQAAKNTDMAPESQNNPNCLYSPSDTQTTEEPETGTRGIMSIPKCEQSEDAPSTKPCMVHIHAKHASTPVVNLGRLLITQAS